ncbi:MAG: glucose-6-phosphate dehydrogenase, partial [Gammaproteobacteria bacterium]|nr:glucose-6-phosphate dehydrogenase [Gammaproteobacteria bacterium]
IKLKKHLDLLSRKQKNSNYLFYFAVPPACIEIIIEQLIKQNLLTEVENGFRRIVVEKPFGSDLASAINLNRKLHSLVNEKQIYRIDHFLGKETVQNLLLFRFSNGLFEPIWNRLYIDHVQITVAETIGIELRGNYYEQAGALRDMVPNHIFQMLSLFAMEPPISFSAYDIHAEKMKVLRAIQTYTPELVLQNAVRGQYDSAMINNQNISSYRTETNVNPQSVVETYVALKLFIDNWRWLRVPFYIRTGKRLPLHTTEIIVQFKSGPPALFKELSNNMKPNLLKIYIQPDEGISLMFNSKIPGPTLRLDQVEMKFKYKDYFGIKPETGYEMILYDCMQGDHLLFKQADMVEMSWRIVQPILDVWHAIPPKDFPNYKAGTWGPISADELLSKDGRRWIL